MVLFDSQHLQIYFIVIIIGVTLLRLYLNYRQKASIKAHIHKVPHQFQQAITLEEHKKAANYNLAKLNLSTIEIMYSSLIALMFTLGGGLQLINNLVSPLRNYPLTQGVATITIFSVVAMILSLPFSIYSTFKIEQKFGFNTMTARLFIVDLIKQLILGAVIMVPLIYAVLWLINSSGKYWFLWVWCVLVGFNLLILLIYPTFIAPLFNKFSPLDNLELKNKIDNLLIKCGFTSKGVFVMDGSKRTTHGNAYFTGFGNSKRIVFFDTLIKKLNHDEIEAVLAHELGHFKKKHILKQIVFSFAINLVTLFILSKIIYYPDFYNALGVSNIAIFNGIILFMLLVEYITIPFAPIKSYFSRKNEFEADEFAYQNSNKQFLIDGLVKLYRDNASTLTPDPVYVKFYYSHPPASVRITHLESLS